MIKQQTLADYAAAYPYQTQSAHGGGHFVALRLNDFTEENVKATTIYSRKDFYKISLLTGDASYFYNDKKYTIAPGEFALIFTNSEIPYRWEIHSGGCDGYACMFTEDFLPIHTYLRPSDWAVFGAESQSVFMLTNEEKERFETLFLKMIEEQDSAYQNKYDLLFLYVLECIHGALKLQPEIQSRTHTAATRLTDSFKMLLAGQFPLATPMQQIMLHTPQAFANKLLVHTNYLNRALKTVTGKTTSQLITERIMQEARALLLHSNWSISQISYCLGFDEPTHFAKAFKKHTGQIPSALRNAV
ncbi:helix-turn-helix domain-containing protein [Flavobacterium zepuense]|uniref:Helix-turn-helix domain-containing protein n=1 Tax=Flavobacterium zepuense TaxID=2593302 RepID=A0A552UX82_9FLAO|nr:helix-turn-helix domain-containing protein [Flavobacterium zepuense]TRW22817.1 helix-turn-helix domain-containing protein [Flavobacterium zepuense]